MSSENTALKKPQAFLPSPTEVYLNAPLYETYQIDPATTGIPVRELLFNSNHIDAYCIYCKNSSTFHRVNPETEYVADHMAFADREYFIRYRCTRSDAHKMAFLIRVDKNTLTKIGQFPALAEISKGELDVYRKPLGPNRFAEFNRAVGLASHGVGIGAFVYLRRVFESLIEEAHQLAIKDSPWSEEAYVKSRVSDRVGLLANHLPPFLVEHKAMYGIMSEGVHSLSEKQCLTAFPVIRVAIELILDQKIEMLMREEKKARISKELNDLLRSEKA